MTRAIKPLVFLLCFLPAGWWSWQVWMVISGDSGRLGPDPAKELALVSGGWAIRMLTLALAITPMRYLFRMPVLWQYRRMIGLYAFFYTALHFLVFLLLLLQLDWADLGSELVERPYITVGFASFVILCGLALTSFNAAQRWLGRKWKTLHRGVYVAAVLAVLHLVWIVRSDFGDALFYGALIAALLIYRALYKVIPAVRSWSLR